MSMLCYSPIVDPQKWSLYTHMPSVMYPIIWNYPLEYTLGDWKYEYGDSLICQLWECDGAEGGCNPDKPNLLPSKEAGDDLLGQATLSMGSFQILGSSLLNMTVPKGGKGIVGRQAATFLLECQGCRRLWQQNPSWVNPYSEQKKESPPPEKIPSPTPPPEKIASPIPPPEKIPSPIPPSGSEQDQQSPPLPEKAKVEEGKQTPEKQDPIPPKESTDPSPAESPPPKIPPIESFNGPTPSPDEVIDDQQDESSSSGPSVMVIVLAILGALVGLLLIAVGIYFILRKCGVRKVEPIEPEISKKDENVARHLRIRVQRPAEADAAMRQHQVDGAMAELPWQPRTAS